MNTFKDARYTIELDKTRHLLFDLNALDQINARFGGYDKLGEILSADNPNYFKDLRWILTLLINEGRDTDEPELTEWEVGRLINSGTLQKMPSMVVGAFNSGTVGAKQAEDDENPTIAATSTM